MAKCIHSRNGNGYSIKKHSRVKCIRLIVAFLRVPWLTSKTQSPAEWKVNDNVTDWFCALSGDWLECWYQKARVPTTRDRRRRTAKQKEIASPPLWNRRQWTNWKIEILFSLLNFMHAIESNFALLYAFFVGRIFGIRYETNRRYDDVEAWGTREGLWSHHGPPPNLKAIFFSWELRSGLNVGHFKPFTPMKQKAKCKYP